MTENERVKEIRKYYNLTMEKFGNSLGVTKTAISNIESGNRSVTEQMRKAICREFNVDYIWLTTGQGEMLVKQSCEDMAVIDRIMDSILNNESEFAKNVFKMFSKYSLEDWKALEQVIRKSSEYMDALKKGE